MKQKTLKETYLFAAFYLSGLGAFGVFMPYLNQYLQTNIGLTGSQIGTYNFITLIAGLFIVPLWGIISDKTGKYKLCLLIIMGGATFMAFMLSMQTGYLAIIACGLGLNAFSNGMMPMADTQAMNFTTKNNQNYGFIRSAGSLGFVLGSILAGFFVTANDFHRMFIPYIALLFLSFVIAFTFPSQSREEKAQTGDQPAERGNVGALIKNKKFLFLCIISLMTVILADSANSYAGIHMVNKLHGPDNSATLFTVATALPEILLLGMIGKAFSKYGFKKIFTLNAIILSVRYIVYFLAPNPTIFLLVSLTHALMTGISTVGNLGYMRAVVPETNYGTAVSVYNTTISVGRAIFSLIFGNLLDMGGSTAIFGFAAIIIVIGTVWILRTKNFDDLEMA